jgi:hypothetical protein
MTRSTRRGLKLVEVLIIIGIIFVVLGLISPPSRRVREAVDRMKCMNNLKVITLAIHNYADMNQSIATQLTGYPAGRESQLFPKGCFGAGKIPEERLSWMVALLPFLEQERLYKEFNLKGKYLQKSEAAATTVKSFLCPAAVIDATETSATYYAALAGTGSDAATKPVGAHGNGFMGYDRVTSISMIKDGTANTIGIMETKHEPGPWARGGSSTLRGFDIDATLESDKPPWGVHQYGINTAFIDGSVRFIPYKTDPKVLAALISIDGGEPLPVLDW